MSGEVPEDRCGYVSDKDVPEYLGEVCCWRPVWQNNNNCIWHSSSPEKTAKEIVNHQQELGERLDEANLSGLDFSQGLTIESCIIHNSDFSKSNLDSAVFVEVCIERTDLTEIKSQGITIKDSNVRNCDFSEGNLRGGEFLETDISDSDLSSSVLTDSDFADVRFIRCSFIDSSIQGSIWKDSLIDDSNFSDSEISSFVMIDGAFSYNKVTNSELTGSIFRESILGDNDFSNSKLAVIELEDSNAWKNNFERANLREAILAGTKIGECNFTLADITEGDLSQTNVLNSDFSNAKLSNTDFTESNARGAIFNGGNLEEAIFDGTELRDASLKNTRLYQTLFSDTRINSNTDFGEKSAYEDADTDLGENYEDTSRLEAAAWVYRRLEDLHEENAMSQKAREYHIRKEEAKRREYRENGEWFKWGVHTANYHLTEHGENLWQVAKWSGFTIGAGTVLYPLLGGIANAGGTHNLWSLSDPSVWDVLLLFARSLYFSTVTFTTLGYGDYHPVGPAAKALAGVESLAGALLVALFVFVLGRRVAR